MQKLLQTFIDSLLRKVCIFVWKGRNQNKNV